MIDQTPYLLALHRRLRITAKRFERLDAFFAGDWQKAYQAKPKDWQAAQVDRAGIERFFSVSEIKSPQEEKDLLQGCGAQVLTPKSQAYPPLWHQIAGAPGVCFYRGNGENLNQRAVAIVGSRKMNAYGERIFSQCLKPLITPPIVIVSGLAFGVDAAAHRHALAAQVPTVAVLGNGIDEIYPKRHQALGRQILEAGGTIVSEYLPQTEARPEYFPERNRLVAGMAQATIVVQAALRSGSLITARLANDMGREVWAVPGDIFSATSAGCNQLIAQGEAAALADLEPLLAALNLNQASVAARAVLEGADATLWRTLSKQSEWEIEGVAAITNMNSADLMAQLLSLELKGYVKKQGEKLYLQ